MTALIRKKTTLLQIAHSKLGPRQQEKTIRASNALAPKASPVITGEDNPVN